MNRKDITVLIYEEEAKLISEWTLQYPNIETGGDLFGLWQNESEVVVQLAIGPGENCRRTTTAFFQDQQYLGNVGNYLTSSQGLCNIGEWHSHHSLNLPEPSAGDKQTIWRHLPNYGLERFLLFIATINKERGQPKANIHSFIFTSPENATRRGEMLCTKYELLPGPNPFRASWEIVAKLNSGVEILNFREDQESDDLERSKKNRKKEKKRGKTDKNGSNPKNKNKLKFPSFSRRKHKKPKYSKVPNSFDAIEKTDESVDAQKEVTENGRSLGKEVFPAQATENERLERSFTRGNKDKDRQQIKEYKENQPKSQNYRTTSEV